MSPVNNATEIDRFLAAAIATDGGVRPAEWAFRDSLGPVFEAIDYNGVAGLLYERYDALQNWPTGLREHGLLGLLLCGKAASFRAVSYRLARIPGLWAVLELTKARH